MKKIIYFIAVTFLAVMVLGCASTSSAKFGVDDASLLKGKTEAQVIVQFGEPYKKSITSEGEKIMEYRQPTKDSGIKNTGIAIVSFGVLSGKDSPYVDIMKIYLKDNIVNKATYEENVQALITLP